MKKATIVSFFHSNNLGDILIAETALKTFSDFFDCNVCDMSFGECDVNVFRKQVNEPRIVCKNICGLKKFLLSLPIVSSILKNFLARISKKPKKALVKTKESESIFFVGGNSIMDLDLIPSNIVSNYRVVKALKRAGKKVYYCFCGVGPFRSKRAKRFAKKMIKEIDFISVRDQASFDLVKSLVPEKEVELWSDIVLLRERKFEENLLKDKNIGVNVYLGDIKSNQKKIKQSFVKIISGLRNIFPDRKIKLFSSELTDIKHVESVKKEFALDNNVEVCKILSIDDLFKLYSELEIVLAVRMHTIITSMLANLPSVTVSWQEKVRSLSEKFNNLEYNFSVDEFVNHPEKVIETIKRCIKNKEIIVKNNNDALDNVRQETISMFNDFIKEYA